MNISARLLWLSVFVVGVLLATSSGARGDSLYETDFNSLTSGPIHGQDQREATDERGSWGDILDLGGGNKVLAVVGGRPGDEWGGEVGRLYNQPSTRRFLTVTFDYLFTVQQGFWFMDNSAPRSTPESLLFSDGQWARSNANPAAYGFWTEAHSGIGSASRWTRPPGGSRRSCSTAPGFLRTTPPAWRPPLNWIGSSSVAPRAAMTGPSGTRNSG